MTLLKQPHTRMTRRWSAAWLGPAIVAAFVLLGLLYSVVLPSWEAPDEWDHFAYARYLRNELALPAQGPNGVATAHHPPLFYLLAALISLPADINSPVGQYHSNPNFLFAAHGGHELNRHELSTGDTFPYAGSALALHLMRWLSLAFGAGTVWLIFKLASEWLPGRPALAGFAAALVAFNPQFIFISAAAMNDALLAFSVTGLLWALGRALRQTPIDAQSPQRAWVNVGVWTGLAAMSKISGLAFAPISAAALLLWVYRARSIKGFWQAGLAWALPVLVLTGWWFARNLALYGELLGTQAWLSHFSGEIRNDPVDWPSALMVMLRSAWAVFGWMTVAAPNWVFSAVWILLGVGALGLIFGGFRHLQARPSGWPTEAWVLLGCAGLALYQLGLIGREILQWNTASQGRYLFPVIAPFALLLSAGWNALLPKRIRRGTLTAVATGLLAVAIFLPLAVIGPNYRMKQTLPRSSVWFARHPWQADFGGQLGLRAYDYAIDPVQPKRLHLTLYWSALSKPQQNYSSFAHVLPAVSSADAELLGQQDQVPGSQMGYLPASWQPDDLVLDKRDIQLTAPLSAGDYVLRLGVYDYQSGQRLPVQPPQASPDFVLLPIRIDALR